jgi:hypothetical protein
MRTLFILVIAAVSTVRVWSAPEDTKTITKIATTAFDIPKEVSTFVERLTKENPEISATYDRLISPTREDAGGRFKVGEFQAIEWLVPDFHVKFTDEGGTRDGEFIYLVRQQLQAGVHRGYTVPRNVVVRVVVKMHEDHRPDSAKDDGFSLERTTLKMHFEGFVDLHMNRVVD